MPDLKFQQMSDDQKKKLTKHTLTDGTATVGEIYLKKEGSDTAFIMWVEIYPDHRRKGYGKTIMKHTIKECRQSGIRKMILLVDYKNDAAQKLYLSVGFVFSGNIKRYKFDDGKDTYCYEMVLFII